MGGLSLAQGRDFDLAVYDKPQESDENLLYSTAPPRARPEFTLRKGRRYQATIALNWLEQIASNESGGRATPRRWVCGG